MSSLKVTGAARIMIDAETERGSEGSAGELYITEGRVDAAPAPDAEVIDASGCVVTPGLINAHHHLMQSAFRTLPGTRGVVMSEWLATMAAAYQRVGITPELCGAAAAVGVAEGLLSGVTTLADHHLNWPAASTPACTVEFARAVTGAARGLGARLVFVRGSARDEPHSAAESAAAIAHALVPVGGVTPDGMLQVAVGPAGVHSDTEETFRLLGEVAHEAGLRRRTQSNEQADVAVAAQKYGKRPLALLEEWGWLDGDVTMAHLCDVTTEEISALAEHGVSATHAPGCDVPMGWGVAPVVQLTESGVVVGMGTSGGGSNDAGHLLADARLAMQVSAIRGRQLSAREVLGMATSGGATGLGRPDLGHLRDGAAGDFCIWDVSGVADAGVSDPLAGLLWANPGRRPRDVFVNGRRVVKDYRLVDVDEQELVAGLDTVLSG